MTATARGGAASFAARCGVHDTRRAMDADALLRRLRDDGIEQVRMAWCDLHGVLRGKTLMASAVASALQDGVGMVSTLMLKDTSDRTAFPVFERDQVLPGFGHANNLLLLPDPASLVPLPWAPRTAWLRAQPWFADGTPVPADPRRVLQLALQRLQRQGLGLRCGLEVEFHVYRIVDDGLDPATADWPGEPPAVRLIHPGYNLLADGWADLADEPLAIVRRTAQGLGLPLRSLEIELGPSQVEAVFDACDALTAADRMVLFRNGVKQALRRAGYHASFVCRPPFPQVMASGWHLHQSLVDLRAPGGQGANAMCRERPAPEGGARAVLSDLGAHYLAGLLHNAVPTLAFCTTTVNGYGRFRPNAMAPMAALWGRDNRGAMLRVLGECGDGDTRIENRIGEPMANPYLYIAAQIAAGLDGIERQLDPGPATEAPYQDSARALPTRLDDALDALEADARMTQAMGPELVRLWLGIKRSEARRHAAAEDSAAWQRREYFSRF